jgi:hypothetical protein
MLLILSIITKHLQPYTEFKIHLIKRELTNFSTPIQLIALKGH